MLLSLVQNPQLQMQTPTVGRIVHYFPCNDSLLGDRDRNNYADVLPAIIVQAFAVDMVNLVVTTANWDTLFVRRLSVPYKTKALAGQAYWDWPERVADPSLGAVAKIPSHTDGTCGDGPTFKQFTSENRA